MHPVYDRPKEVKLLKWAKEGSELHKLELHPSQWKCGDYTAAGIRAAVILDTLTFINLFLFWRNSRLNLIFSEICSKLVLLIVNDILVSGHCDTVGGVPAFFFNNAFFWGEIFLLV